MSSTKIPLTDFGKLINRALDDICQTKEWLIAQVAADTGKYFDSSYLFKIQTGRYINTGMVASICKVLNIQPTDENISPA